MQKILEKICTMLFITNIVLALFVIFLGVYYYHLLNDVQGYRNETISLSKSLVEELNRMYLENSNNEFGACITGNETHFEKYYGYVVGSKNSLIRSQTCFVGNTTALMHSHPNKECILSYNDAIGHYMSKIKYTMIMCGINKFRIFDKDDYYKSYKVEIT